MASCLVYSIDNNLNFTFGQALRQVATLQAYSGATQSGLQFAHQLRRRIQAGIAHQSGYSGNVNSFFAQGGDKLSGGSAGCQDVFHHDHLLSG
jgi:hypothetical protein